MLRDGLAAVLAAEPDIEVVGVASDGEAIIDLVQQLTPDVLVLDISMPGMSGIEVARRLHNMKASVKILALSAYDAGHYVKEMLKAGGAGYLTKASATTELTRAIREVDAGNTYLSPEITSGLLERVVADARSGGAPAGVLSAREQEVVRCVAGGLRSAEIAQRLGIAVATVEVHRRNIMRKLDLHSVADLTRYAMREGMTGL
jgi:two-component system NarL family response regulator